MSAHRFEELPADRPIPVSMAHNVVGRGRATVYRWIARGLLVPTETPDGMTVTPAQVRAVEATITRGRPTQRVVVQKGDNVR